jgi:hypothetical protein
MVYFQRRDIKTGGQIMTSAARQTPTRRRRKPPADSPARAQWPADAIERRPLSALVPYARNARLHSEAQVAQIAASMREWGWTTPILVSEDGTVIAGHGRLLAARKLELADAPVMVARGWSAEKIRAYVIADNRLAENAAWDRQMLGAELASLQTVFDLSLTGFTAGEIDALCVSELPPLGVEYSESAADAVKMATCPACGHQFPR